MSVYIINEQAIADINQIWLYTAENWSIEQADRYYNLILDEIEYIAENYESTYDFGRFKKGYRFTKVKSHVIFFRKIYGDEVEIVRVMHERMDIDNML